MSRPNRITNLDRFRALVEANPYGGVIVDRNGAIVLANTVAAKMFGYRRHELRGRELAALVPSLREQKPPQSLSGFVNQIFATGRGWTLIIAGHAIGFVFAAVVLTTTVVAFPLLQAAPRGFTAQDLVTL